MGEKQHKMMVFTSGIYIYPLSWEIKSLNPYLDTSHLSTVSYFVKFLFLLSLEHGENRSRIGFITQNMETVGRTLKKSGLAGLYFIWSRAKWRVSCHCHLTSPPES
jgi:hypothetical protein